MTKTQKMESFYFSLYFKRHIQNGCYKVICQVQINMKGTLIKLSLL